MPSITKVEVETFLAEFRKFWPPKHFVVPRVENNEALIDLNLTPQIRREIIYHLSANNYVRGPEQDYTKQGEYIWEFGFDYDGVEIYIKLQIIKREKFSKCISFHRPKYKIRYKLI